MDYYTLNLPKCKKKIDSFLLSQKFLKLPRRWQSVTECIFRTILASPNLYCNKSNRTISAETGVSIHVINQVRLWLESERVVSILRLRNGKRVNQRYLLQMACCTGWVEIGKMTEADKKRYATILGLSMGELSQAKINDIIDLNKFGLEDTVLKKNIDSAKEVYQPSDADLDFSDKFSYNYSKSFKTRNENSLEELITLGFGSPSGGEINTKILDKIVLEDKPVELFSDLSMLEKAQVLEFNGFTVVPANGKKMYKGNDYLRGIGKKGRIDLVRKVEQAHETETWQEFYSMRMGEVAFNKFHSMATEFGNNGKWSDRLKNLRWNYEYYRQYNNLGVVLGKNMVVIDIDWKAWHLVDSIKAIVPGCLVQETPRGFHIFAKDPHKTLAGISMLAQGIDIKGFTSHVVVSDSENKYNFISGDFQNVPDLPQDFICRFADVLRVNPEDLLNYREETSAKKEEVKPIDVNNSTVTFRGKFQLPDFLYVTERNRTLMRYSFHLRARGFSAEIIEKEIRAKALDKKFIEEPLLEREIVGIMKQVKKRKNAKDFVQIVPMWSITNKNISI